MLPRVHRRDKTCYVRPAYFLNPGTQQVCSPRGLPNCILKWCVLHRFFHGSSLPLAPPIASTMMTSHKDIHPRSFLIPSCQDSYINPGLGPPKIGWAWLITLFLLGTDSSSGNCFTYMPQAYQGGTITKHKHASKNRLRRFAPSFPLLLFLNNTEILYEFKN